MKGQVAGALIAGGLGVLGKVVYGPAEAAVRSSRGLAGEIYPMDTPGQWIVPAFVGLGVGIVSMFAPKLVGASLAAIAAGALVEAARRRAL